VTIHFSNAYSRVLWFDQSKTMMDVKNAINIMGKYQIMVHSIFEGDGKARACIFCYGKNDHKFCYINLTNIILGSKNIWISVLE
jgi:hypothetical protein